MINNTILPPVTQPSVQRPAQSPSQAQDQVQSPERPAVARSSENRERENPRNQRVEYIPAIPDEEALEALRSAQPEWRREGPTAAYGDVEAMSATSNRGRLLDVYA